MQSLILVISAILAALQSLSDKQVHSRNAIIPEPAYTGNGHAAITGPIRLMQTPNAITFRVKCHGKPHLVRRINLPTGTAGVGGYATIDLMIALVILFGLSIVLLYAGQRFNIPSIISFLVIGILLGPYGLAVITNQPAIAMFAEIGILLLLFTIGLEFSFEKLLQSRKAVIIGGLVQVCTTIAAITAITYLLGWPFNEAVFFGFLVSLSSTAIVMKILQEQGQIETLSGRTMLGILIFQDLAIIPMILVTPLLIGGSSPDYGSLPLAIVKVLLILAILVAGAVWLVPQFLYRVVKLRNRELFLFTIAGICFITAWLTSAAGLSLTLGAFIAGLIIGESDYSIDALSSVIPFRDVFAAMFFLSIGMMMNIQVIVSGFSAVVLVVATIIGVKILTGILAGVVLRVPDRVSLDLGFSLCQIGEFSFVLAATGLSAELIPDMAYQIFLAGAIVTMALTPFSMRATPGIAGWIGRLKPSVISSSGSDDGIPDTPPPPGEPGSLLVIGYGITGKSIVRAAELAGIPFTVVDVNPDIVGKEREKLGEKIVLGDATHREVLVHAGISRAQVLLLVISERHVVPRIVRLARQLSPSLYIIVRSYSVEEVDDLLKVGADEVIPAEFEAAIGIFSRVLRQYTIPDEEIENFAHTIRDEGYRLFSRSTEPDQLISGRKRQITDFQVHALQIPAGSPWEGKRLEELNLSEEYGATMLAIRREGVTKTGVTGDTVLNAGDLLLLYAGKEDIRRLTRSAHPAGPSPGEEPESER